jgi:hypothetical protein
MRDGCLPEAGQERYNSLLQFGLKWMNSAGRGLQGLDQHEPSHLQEQHDTKNQRYGVE